VKCSGKTRTLTVKYTDTFEIIQVAIKNSFDLQGVPNLYIDGQEITEAVVKNSNILDVFGGKQVTCEIFNPWNISSADDKGVDYDKLINIFGVKKIKKEDIQRLEAITKRPAHPWIRRGFFFCYRDFDKILETLERKETVYLYTGRGPSSESLHLGHIIQFMFAKYLQEALGAVLVIQMSNDEKYIFKKQLSLEEVEQMTIENTRDIIACGFDIKRTFIFSDLDYVGKMYRPILTLLKNTTAHTESKIYGFDGSSPAGYYTWPCIQAAPAFSCAFPFLFGPKCLIPFFFFFFFFI
jgi:tryptophanyl-tRNA synthetase